MEIQNTGAIPVALEDYRLADADRTIRFALSGTLAPGELKFVPGSAAVLWQRATSQEDLE